MTENARPTPTRIPAAWSDEDGEIWWADGHWSDEAMLLAVVFEQLAVAGMDSVEVVELLVGSRRPFRSIGDDRACAVKLAERLDSVCRVWMAPDADNDERWHICDETSPNARPVTRFDA